MTDRAKRGGTGVLALGLALTILSACAGEGAGTRGPTLTGAGATFAMPLITLWSSEYELATGGRVNYNSIGSGGGIRAHTDRTVDFAASEAPLTVEQFAGSPGYADHPVHHRVRGRRVQPAGWG